MPVVKSPFFDGEITIFTQNKAYAQKAKVRTMESYSIYKSVTKEFDIWKESQHISKAFAIACKINIKHFRNNSNKLTKWLE